MGSLTATGGANGTSFFTGTGGGNAIGYGTNDILTATGPVNNVIAATATPTVTGAQTTGQNTFFAFGANASVIGGVGWTGIESGPGKQTLVAGSGSTLFDSRRRAEPGNQYRTFRR